MHSVERLESLREKAPMRGARIRGKAEFAGTKPRMLLKIKGEPKIYDKLSHKATILLKTIKLPSEMGSKCVALIFCSTPVRRTHEW